MLFEIETENNKITNNQQQQQEEQEEKQQEKEIKEEEEEVKELSLQESFAKFLKNKKEERKLIKKLNKNKIKERNENYKNDLRNKFILQAKKYLGIPYSKKYKEEGQPDSPLYLDCCGLVRQVLKDLQYDFGFVIDKWNQAYQFDTLPIRYNNHTELKPGDLIFYSGYYNSKRSKLQKHDMVHVEIYLGGETGLETIGARYQKGVIQIFPSYQFESKLWSLKEYHFCSIETWLDGICQSHCQEHPWINTKTRIGLGGKSIFDDDNDNEQDISAGDDFDDNDDYEQQIGNENNQHQHEYQNQNYNYNYNLKNKNNYNDNENYENNNQNEYYSDEQEDPDMIGGGDGDDDEYDSDTKLKKLPSRDHSKSEQKRSVISHQNTSDSIASQAKLNTRVSRSRSMDSAPGAEKKSNTNTDNTTTSTSTSTSTSTTGKTSKANKTLTYYVGEGNGWRFIKAALDKRGWQQIPFEYKFSTRFSMKWVERRSQIDYSSHHDGQLVNHIPNNDIITTKLGMLNCLRNYYCTSSSSLKQERIPTPWLPETFQLDILSDCLELLEKDKQLQRDKGQTTDSSEPSHLWIYKPSSSNRGRGVKVVQGGQELIHILHEYHPQSIDSNGNVTKSSSSSSSSSFSNVVNPPRGIIQEYIMRPLLVEGFKFDLRCYMLIARVSPMIVYYHPGYCRRTLRQYSLDPSSLDDPIIHLSNTSIQKKASIYKDQKENQVQLRDALANAIENDGDRISADYIRYHLDDEIKQCMVDIIRASKDQFQKKNGYFDLFGFDFMVTGPPHNKTVLLEANTNPALCVNMNELITELIDGTMELVLSNHQISSPSSSSKVSSTSTSTSAIPENFYLIYDEENHYEFTKETKK